MQNTSRCSIGDTKRGSALSFIPKLQPSKNYVLNFGLLEGEAISFSESYLYEATIRVKYMH